MKIYFKRQKAVRRIFYFFPLQLILMTLKKNFYYVAIWLFFFALITHSVGLKFGVPYLFLYPEYLNKVNFLSYFILGFSCGGLIMAYNISSYIINSFRFPFLATIERPFFVFCINNCFIPIVFIVTYTIAVFHFRVYDYAPASFIAFHLSGFAVGIFAFILITIIYFYLLQVFFRKTAWTHSIKSVKMNFNKIKKEHEINVLGNIDTYLPLSYSDRSWFVETYLTGKLSIGLARVVRHYSNSLLERIFKHNDHIAAGFEIISIVSLLLMGFFRGNPIFMIPAAASLMLLFTIILMSISALHNWVGGWTTVVIILLFFCINYFSRTHWDLFSAKAYGMNYTCTPAEYSLDALKRMNNDTAILRIDKSNMLATLEHWKSKNSVNNTSLAHKPSFIIINNSGGGLRSTLWSFYTLQYLDSIFKGQVFKHAEIITGSSGGIIGASYFRELYLENEQGKTKDIDSRIYFNKIGQDLLNPIIFNLATNDLAFRLQQFKDGKYTYTKDRAFAFEEKLNINTDSLLNKRLRDYKCPEEYGQIPLLFVTPTIINDGRKMLISPQGLSFMTIYQTDDSMYYVPSVQSVEFSRLFKRQDAQNLLFTSALRMNSTFPFITPITEMPSIPRIELMDAGLIDNYGLEEAVKYVYTFQDWLAKNTGRIIIIQTRDQIKEPQNIDNSPSDILTSITFPVSQFYNSLFPVESFKEDRVLEYMSKWYKGEIDVLYFELNNVGSGDISLSWRLTDREKSSVINSMKTQGNINSIEKLKKLLNGDIK